MTTEPTPGDALRGRAERGDPRGADAVLSAARAEAERAPAPLAPPARTGASRRWIGAAAALFVVGGLVAAIAVAGRSSQEEPAAPGEAFCTVLAARAEIPPQVEGDLIVYVEPGADPATSTEIGDELRASDLVAAARYIDEAETYRQFRELFAGQDEMLENVRPEDLPTAFEVDLVPGWTDAEGMAFITELRARPNVFEVRSDQVPRMRVLDVLVTAGIAPELVAALEADLVDEAKGAPWRAQVEAAVASAPPGAADAISLLDDGLTDQEPPMIDGPEVRAGVDAADALRQEAADRCSLTVPAFLTGPSGDVATTTTAVPVEGN